jgi:hypothetical protein
VVTVAKWIICTLNKVRYRRGLRVQLQLVIRCIAAEIAHRSVAVWLWLWFCGRGTSFPSPFCPPLLPPSIPRHVIGAKACSVIDCNSLFCSMTSLLQHLRGDGCWEPDYLQQLLANATDLQSWSWIQLLHMRVKSTRPQIWWVPRWSFKIFWHL